MGIFKRKRKGEVDYKEYTDMFQNLPYYKTCNMNFASLIPNRKYSHCVKIDVDIFIEDSENGKISDSEFARINAVEQIMNKLVNSTFVGKGVMCSTGTAFLLFYIPKRSIKKVSKIYSAIFETSFSKPSINITSDPKGEKYFELVYTDKSST